MTVETVTKRLESLAQSAPIAADDKGWFMLGAAQGDLREALTVLERIPPRSRLYKDAQFVLSFYAEAPQPTH